MVLSVCVWGEGQEWMKGTGLVDGRLFIFKDYLLLPCFAVASVTTETLYDL